MTSCPIPTTTNHLTPFLPVLDGPEEVFATILPERYTPTIDGEKGRIIDLVRFCIDYGLPYPVETRPDYSKSWHALHEIGHFAVMPPWARKLGIHVMGIATTEYNVNLSGKIGVLSCYGAGNDVLPKTGFIYGDPLPYEMATRAWSIEMLDYLNWPHPKDFDPSFCKLMSFLVWDPNQPGLDTDRARMRYFGIDFPNSPVAIDDGFTPPHPKPTTVPEVIGNLRAISLEYSGNSDYPYVPFDFTEEPSSDDHKKYLESCMQFLPCVT